MFTLYNLYIIEVDHKNRNCYNYREFGYLTRNYKNKGIGYKIRERRRLEYRGNRNNEKIRIIEKENG